MNRLRKQIRIGLALAGLLMISFIARPLLGAGDGDGASARQDESNFPARAQLIEPSRAGASKDREGRSEFAPTDGGGIIVRGQGKPDITVTCPDQVTVGALSVPASFDPPNGFPAFWSEITINKFNHNKQQVVCWYGKGSADVVISRSLPIGYNCETYKKEGEGSQKIAICKHVGIKIGK